MGKKGFWTTFFGTCEDGLVKDPSNGKYRPVENSKPVKGWQRNPSSDKGKLPKKENK